MSLVVRKPVFGFPTRSDTNRAVKSQKMTRSLTFLIKEVEILDLESRGIVLSL